MSRAKFINEHQIEYASRDGVFNGIKYKPTPDSILEANGYYLVENTPVPEEHLPYDYHWEWKWTNTNPIIKVWEQVEDDTTPVQRRQNAYATRPIIEFGNEIITVDEARNICNEYQYDGTERAQQIIAELSVKIAEAKEAIREEYPDEETTNE